MAVMKLFLCAVFLSLALAGVGVDADASISAAVEESRWDGPDSASLERLRTKIQDLEHHIEDKTRELKEKDKLMKEKSDTILALEGEISSLQEKGNSDAVEQLGKAHARVDELEKQTDSLERDLEAKIKENEQVEARASEAEKKSSELHSRVISLQKIISDQNSKLQRTERALQIAEEEMMKAKFEAISKTKELMEVHGAWFPPWLAAHLIHYQSSLATNWNIHGKPALDQLMEKAIKKKARAEEWAAPHFETIKNKWAPVVKEKWAVITRNVRPHVQTLTTKSIEMYKSSKNALSPHVIFVLEFIDPYFQDLRKISSPYIDRVADAARPRVEAFRSVLKPYAGKFLESAKNYHHHVQDKVHEKLKSHELTEPLATKELVWFSASALLALPVIFLVKICSVAFWLVSWSK